MESFRYLMWVFFEELSLLIRKEIISLHVRWECLLDLESLLLLIIIPRQLGDESLMCR